MSEEAYPTVSVVIATRDRPVLLRRALHAVLAQDYPGRIECLLVFDQSEPDDLRDVRADAGCAIQVLTNRRQPGLAGARNTGIIAASGELVAFCDDDDEWLPAKLRLQIDLRRRRLDAAVVATGVCIVTGDGRHERIPAETTTFADFLTSRVSEIHPSTLLFRRRDLLGAVGLVDEELPASYGEDYDLLLRATRVGPVLSVPLPLVTVYWNRPSFFAGRWDAIAAALTYLLGKVPEFGSVPRGRARIEGQIAFAHAARGRTRQSVSWALRSLRHDPRQVRAVAALAVAGRVVSAERLVSAVQARGKGL